ncbi:N-acetylmuramoyl-L-alanine amidase [Clostridium sp. ASF356]|nr:N-acetylmuramoyl-L-alanine amidase [Clostridium sp. MD294]
MYEEKVARVVLEIKDTAEYDMSQNGNHIIVTVKKSTLENISYDASKKALVLKKVMPFDVNGVIHTDNYLKNQYKVTLPSDFTSVYGYGTMKLPYEGVSSVTVANEGGRTTFSFSESNIRAYTITEDSNNYYINIKNPKEVYSKVVLLDAGHGGNDPGTSGNGMNEKDITLSIVNKAYALLQNTDKVKVYLTRNDDSRPENRHRANTANDIADVLISIHMNSASPNPSPNGTEVLFVTHTNDVQGRLTSQIVATTLLQRTVNALSTNNRGLKYDTQHQKNLILLNSTTVPAVIVETLFLSNPGDALKISNTANHDKMAQAIYDSIIELADKYTWR